MVFLVLLMVITVMEFVIVTPIQIMTATIVTMVMPPAPAQSQCNENNTISKTFFNCSTSFLTTIDSKTESTSVFMNHYLIYLTIEMIIF
jgi:hypothetical protein